MERDPGDEHTTGPAEASKSPEELQKELKSLEEKNERLKTRLGSLKLKHQSDTNGEHCTAVQVPVELELFYKKAEKEVRKIFQSRSDDPLSGIIKICGQRYIMIRGPALTVEFLELVKALFGGEEKEAISFVTSMMFELGHIIGKADAKHYATIMNLVDPISKLSAGLAYFAFTGWGVVNILPQSIFTPNGEFCAVYDHPHSFEAESYKPTNQSPIPTCHLNAGYLSGWCEEGFEMKLVSREIQCTSRGDPRCRFIMAPPDRISGRIAEYQQTHLGENVYVCNGRPDFFERRGWEEQAQRKAFNELKEQYVALRKEREKKEKLLMNTFPESVVRKIQLGQKNVAQRHANVTILFADVVDFTNTAASLDAKVVLVWLNTIFCTIDELADKYFLEKIKTVGDAYVLAGGISLPLEDHINATLNLACELVDKLKSIRDPTGKVCQMRIGIGTGPVCSGVIGKKKVTFDILGECVSMASRLQSLADPGQIQCTESVKLKAGEDFEFEYRGELEVPGKENVKCYYCKGKTPQVR